MQSVDGCHKFQILIISAPPSDKESLERIIWNIVLDVVNGLFIQKYIINMMSALMHLQVNS